MTTKKIKLLIIDDDVELREMYAEIFQEKDFEVSQAEDGVDGLNLATKELPDIIFTGIVMPRMDGFSLIEELKKNMATSSIPIVISSHMGREEDRERANNLGVKDFIVRGVTPPNEVVQRIKATFVKNETYKLEFDHSTEDAQRLAKDLNIGSDFKCSKCGEKILLVLQSLPSEKQSLRAKLVCSKCGEEA